MKLFVDDLRECPLGWTLARTVTEAIRILATQPVDVVSLDHDIECHTMVGETFRAHTSPETFEPVAWFLREVSFGNSEYLPVEIRIHTANIVAAKTMESILSRTGSKLVVKVFAEEDYK